MKVNSLSFIIRAFGTIAMLLFGFALGKTLSPSDPELWFMDWMYLITPILFITAAVFLLLGFWAIRQKNRVSGRILSLFALILFGFCLFSMGYSYLIDSIDIFKWWFALYYINASTIFYAGIAFILATLLIRKDETFNRKKIKEEL